MYEGTGAHQVDHATRTLARSKTQGDIRQTLAAVTAEIEEEHRQRDERHAAEQEVMAERQAMFEAAWEAERNGDPDWFAKLLASGWETLGFRALAFERVLSILGP